MASLNIAQNVSELACRSNEKHILTILRSMQQASKAQLARLTGLTAVAVGGLIKSLESKGLVENIGKVQGDMGQPATLYALCSAGAFGLGVSINRGHFETVLLNFVGEVLVSYKHEALLPSPDQVLDIVRNDIANISSQITPGVLKRIIGLGVAQPFNIDARDQDVPAWQKWSNCEFSQCLGAEFGTSVVCQNDVNAAAMAEYAHGSILGSDSFIYVYFGGALSANLGSALIFEGKCWVGVNGNAGDIGLTPVGETNISELCALHSLVKYFQAAGFDINSHDELNLLAQTEVDIFESWVGDWVRSFQSFIFTVQALLDLPQLVFDCEDVVAPIVDRLVEALKQTLQESKYEGLLVPKVMKGSFGGHASAIGAASLPLESQFGSN